MPARTSVHNQHDPGASARADVQLAPGQQLRDIIRRALDRRKVLRFKGAGHVPEMLLQPAVMRLENWLRYNPHPSPATVKRFDLGADLALVMPSTAEGRKLMDDFRQLVN